MGRWGRQLMVWYHFHIPFSASNQNSEVMLLRPTLLVPSSPSLLPPSTKIRTKPSRKLKILTSITNKTMRRSSNGDWLRKSIGQRLNLEGIAFFLRIISTQEGKRLALPHINVPDIRWVDWRALEQLGFKGVVFDKDNTLTSPYSLSLWPPIATSFGQCISTFPRRVAIYSNSAGNHSNFRYCILFFRIQRM